MFTLLSRYDLDYLGYEMRVSDPYMRVTKLEPTSCFQGCGIRPEDGIITVNGKDFDTMQEFAELCREKRDMVLEASFPLFSFHRVSEEDPCKVTLWAAVVVFVLILFKSVGALPFFSVRWLSYRIHQGGILITRRATNFSNPTSEKFETQLPCG